MKQLLAFLTGKFSYSDQEIIDMLQNGVLKDVRIAENLLFEKFRYWISRKPFTEILKEKLDREEAYSDANLTLLNNLKAGRFEGRSSLETYYFEIYRRKCVTRLRQNATKKNVQSSAGSMPSEAMLKNIADDVQIELANIQAQEPSTTWDMALKQFRHTNYRCFYVLALHDGMNLSYEYILDFAKRQQYEFNDGKVVHPDDLMHGLKDAPLNIDTPTLGALKALASRCRAALRALFEQIKQPTQTHTK